MSLRLRANIAFATGALLLLLIGALAVRSSVHADALSQARRQAELLTAENRIAGRYTAEKVAPLLAEGGRALVFVPAAAPFAATEAQARMLAQAEPGVSVRQVVLDPVGAADRPSAEERAAIDKLRSNPDPQPYTREFDGPDGPLVSLVTPLLFSPGVCATCYTSRSAAPAGIVDAFGGSGGFDRKPGEIIGLTIATVPLPSLHAATTAVIWMALMAAALLGLFNILLSVLVLKPLSRVADVAERISLGQTGVEEFAHAGNDEIGTITRSFNRLRRSMESAIGLLES
ncbi:DUF3365 domain-containing protein [Acetobacteraceae bacterium KSS8]|uniref:histidine kinase n=1 Tax=Endosaccharibacter trunci TaxID=2812733 RepID=A0ABT1W701_9PROT|nr:DUF3365 domain-containing protein [Acetobacteraceae bacterium KSS8]